MRRMGGFACVALDEDGKFGQRPREIHRERHTIPHEARTGPHSRSFAHVDNR